MSEAHQSLTWQLRPEAQTDRARVEALNRSADGGAELVVFPETFIPGYPSWIWRLRPGDDGAVFRELHKRLSANAMRGDSGWSRRR